MTGTPRPVDITVQPFEMNGLFTITWFVLVGGETVGSIVRTGFTHTLYNMDDLVIGTMDSPYLPCDLMPHWAKKLIIEYWNKDIEATETVGAF